MNTVKFQNSNSQDITMAANIHYPSNFDETQKYAAIVVAHPGGGVKEQTAG
ncbi:alpha/beta hydrolase, partial [Acinetobacter baumannii]